MSKKNKIKINTTTNDLEVSKIIKILLGVLIVLGITYLVASLITGNIKLGNKNKKEDSEISIQYEEILAGETLNRSEEEYYVMYFNFTDNVASSYITFKDLYEQKENALKIYLVDLEKGFNKDFIKNDENDTIAYANKIDDVKVSNPTILKIVNHKVVEYIDGKENVLNYLIEITK